MILLKRVLVAGFKGFYRNKTISAASIFILVLTLSIIASLFLFKAVFDYSVTEIKDKVDISIYLKKDASDASIISIKQKLQQISGVKEVVYVTREETLNNFKEDYKNDTETLNALNELGVNPFGASFSVKANDTPDYENVMKSITEDKILGDDFNSIEKINYFDIKDSINRLNSIILATEKFGFFMIIIFIIMSIMIIYNTVRLAIFTFKEEISVMKLVGASNMYVRGPFIVESIIYGFSAAIITILFMYPFTVWLKSKTFDFLAGFDIQSWYSSNIFQIFFVLLLSGIIVAAVSSLLAVRKYLKV